MDAEQPQSAGNSTTQNQKMSVLVRARLLFQKEVEIERNSGLNIFDAGYAERLIAQKKIIDQQMLRAIGSSFVAVCLLYFVTKGMQPTLPFMGVNLSLVPGIKAFRVLFASFSMAIGSYQFFNLQMYSAVIDQVILHQTKNGLIDAEMVKASYETEWLVFKALRRDFSFYSPVYINFSRGAQWCVSASFVLMATIAVSPFLFLLIAVPYLSLFSLDGSIVGYLVVAFSHICSFSVFWLLLIMTVGLNAEVNVAEG